MNELLLIDLLLLCIAFLFSCAVIVVLHYREKFSKLEYANASLQCQLLNRENDIRKLKITIRNLQEAYKITCEQINERRNNKKLPPLKDKYAEFNKTQEARKAFLNLTEAEAEL